MKLTPERIKEFSSCLIISVFVIDWEMMEEHNYVKILYQWGADAFSSFFILDVTT